MADATRLYENWQSKEIVGEVDLSALADPILHTYYYNRPLPPPTLRDRLSDFAGRIRDAWLVLRGKASIGDW